jgi:hypothetical protein
MSETVFVSKGQLLYALKSLSIPSKTSPLLDNFRMYLTVYQNNSIEMLNNIRDEFEKRGTLRKRNIKTDDYSRIFPEKEPRYHLSKDCKFLNSDYVNGFVPEEFRVPDKVNEYRNWFKENMHLLGSNERHLADFNIKHEKKWGFHYKGKIEHSPHSGSEKISNRSKLELLKDAFVLKIKYDNQILANLEKGDGRLLTYISRYAKTTVAQTKEDSLKELVTSYGDNFQDVQNWLTDYRTTFQYPLNGILHDLFVINTFPNNSMKTELSEALGFVLCANCLKNTTK